MITESALGVILLIFTFLIIGLTCAIFARLVHLFYISSQGAFFARTSGQRLKNIIELAEINGGEKVVDLGCGDGEIAIALAQEGALVDGIEIDPYYVWRGRRKIQKLGLQQLVSIEKADMWDIDLSQYDLVVVYGIAHIMERLENKIEEELKEGARVISVYFEFPNWKVEANVGDVRLYCRPNNKGNNTIR